MALIFLVVGLRVVAQAIGSVGRRDPDAQDTRWNRAGGPSSDPGHSKELQRPIRVAGTGALT